MSAYVTMVRNSNGTIISGLLTADTELGLLNMARQIGVPVRARAGRAFINLFPGQAVRAVDAGAIKITMMQHAQMAFCRGRTGKPCTLAEAADYHVAYLAQRRAKRSKVKAVA